MTENIKETAEEVKEYIVARLKVPIFFYYLLALAIWNWDILALILKSNFEIESIIWFIKTNYSGHGRIWKPFLIALASSIFFPAVMVGLDWFLKFVNKERIKSSKQVAEAEAEAQYDIQVKRNKTDKLAELNDKIKQLSTEKEKIDKNYRQEIDKIFALQEKYDVLVIENERHKKENKNQIKANDDLKEKLDIVQAELDLSQQTNAIILEDLEVFKKEKKAQTKKEDDFNTLKKKIGASNISLNVLVDFHLKYEYFSLSVLENSLGGNVNKLVTLGIIEKDLKRSSNIIQYKFSSKGNDFIKELNDKK